MNHAANPRASQAEGTFDLQNALQMLRHENRTYTARAFGCGACWLLAIYPLLMWIAGWWSISALIFSLSCLGVGTVLIPSSDSRALRQLEDLQDSRAIPVLIDSIEVSFGAKVQAVRSLLTQLLAQLTSADAGLLNRSQLAALRRELELETYNTTLDYALVIVAALAHIGNQETANRLRELIKRGAVTERQQHIRQAAEQWLPVLEARLVREGVSGTLLRASSSQNADELLHPAASHPAADTGTLLQSANRPID